MHVEKNEKILETECIWFPAPGDLVQEVIKGEFAHLQLEKLSTPTTSQETKPSSSELKKPLPKDKKKRKKDLIRLCAALTGKFLTTLYKSKIIRFKMDEDPLQRRIYFLTFIDSLDMIFLNIEKLVKSF